MARAMAAANESNPHEVAWSRYYAATLRAILREYDQAKTLAAQALEFSEKNQFPQIAAYSRCVLGLVQAQLGRSTEGVALIHRGIGSLLEVGSRGYIGQWTTYLAAAQESEGAHRRCA
jgi:hypothetical protein